MFKCDKISLLYMFQLFSFINYILKIRFQRKFYHRNFADSDFPDLNTKLSHYGIYVPVFIGESFAALRSIPVNLSERYAITALGAMTGVFDDLFDKFGYTRNDVEKLLHHSNYEEKWHPYDIELIRLLHIFNVNSEVDIKSFIVKIAEAQLASNKQRYNNLSKEELCEITFNKGGFSMQLYRRAFYGDVSVVEDLFFYKIGALGQLANDVFDVYKDFKAGIYTLPLCIRLSEVKTIYLNLYAEICKLLNELNYSNREKKRFLQLLSLIAARALVALEQYMELSDGADVILKPEIYSRKQLICDMEKPKMLLKLFSISAKLNEK